MKKFRWYDYLTINLFWLGLNFRNTSIGSVFIPYLVAEFVPYGLQNTALGIMRTVGLIIAMLAQPMMGILSDRSTSRFGRRRPFILVGVLLDLIFLAFLARSLNYWMLLASLVLIQLSSNISHGALQALIPDLVPDSQKGKASAVKSIFELIPIILVGATVAQLVGMGRFDLAVVFTSVVLLLTMVLTIVFVKETPLIKKPDVPLTPAMLRVLGLLLAILAGGIAGIAVGGFIGGLAGILGWVLVSKQAGFAIWVGLGSIIAMVTAIIVSSWTGTRIALGRQSRQHADFTWWIANRFMFLAAITSFQGFAPFFFMYAFGITNEEAANMNGDLIVIVGVFVLLTALPSGWLTDRLGPKKLVGISGLLATLGAVMVLPSIWFPNLTVIYIGASILGIATGLFVTTNWAMGTQLVPIAEAGRYLGISNLAGAGAGMIGSGIGGPVADYYLNLGFPGMGYFVIYSGYAILFLLSVFCLHGINLQNRVKIPLAGQDYES